MTYRGYLQRVITRHGRRTARNGLLHHWQAHARHTKEPKADDVVGGSVHLRRPGPKLRAHPMPSLHDASLGGSSEEKSAVNTASQFARVPPLPAYVSVAGS